MRPGIGAVIGVLWASALAPAGAAEVSTVFVVPGRPGVPVVINGWDASYMVVEGEFGLGRPGQVNPVIVGGLLIAPSQLHFGPYYPRAGHPPGYGRLEVEPPANRRLPPPAQSYHRSWSSQSEPLPASIDPPAEVPDVSVNIDADGRDLRRRDRELRREERRRHRDQRANRRHYGGGHRR